MAAQLIREIETSKDDLQSRATAILKAKNRLAADDAKLVEDAFAARITLQDGMPEDMTTDGPGSALSDRIRPQPTTDQRGPPRRRGQGDAPEKSKPRPSNPAHPRSSQSRSMTNSSRLQHTFKTTPLRPRSTKANSPSARCVGSATRPTSNSLRRSRVWSAGEAPQTPTIYGSPSPARWGARSATSLPYLCAELITGTTIASATSTPGGANRPSIRSKRHGSSGY